MTDFFSKMGPFFPSAYVLVCPVTDLSFSVLQDQHIGLLNVQQVYGIVCSLLPLSLDVIYFGGKPGWQTLQLFTDIYCSSG